MVYLALGLLLVGAVMLGARWYVSASPATLFQVFKWGSIGFVGLVGGYLAATGRLGWALFAAPVVFPLVNRLRQWFRAGVRFPGGASEGIGSPGQTSEVRTRFVRMVLDHDTGEMNGDVLIGHFAGKTLRSLSLAEIVAALGEARDDPESVQLLSAYLDRYHGEEWRETAASSAGTGDRGAGAGASGMSRGEAFEILGLASDADEAAIKAAHHRLMSKIHPDLGGSTYLAAKINQAKDVLLGP